MDFQAVKGTRDFYPGDMRRRNAIVDAWRRVSLRNGFEEYDAPIFEYLDLFTVKSGQEIASQLFSFTDRGERNLAIRPEITPSLARMVNAKINALPRPIKWFSVPRLCRAENPQKGRLREFFQWNIDIIGEASVLADAECLFTCVDFLREVGLGPSDVQVRIGSRALVVGALKALGVGDDNIEGALAVLDKRAKVNDTEFARLANCAGLTDAQIDAMRRWQDCDTLDGLVRELEGMRLPSEATDSPLADLATILNHLKQLGVSKYCKLDLGIVRGLAYYTGVVYEVFDRGQSLRAIAGGGRYDNLLEVLGGPKMGATGFGMGDVVLGILLDEKGKLLDIKQRIDFFVINPTLGSIDPIMHLVGALRRRGYSAEFCYEPQQVGKQFKQANKRGAKFAVIVEAGGTVAVKDLSTGTQGDDVPTAQFLSDPMGTGASQGG